MPTILRPTALTPFLHCLILFFLLPLTFSSRSSAAHLRSSLRDLLGARNPTNCPQSHICRISTLARYWLPLSGCHTIANSLRVYRRSHVCKISMLRDINQKKGISAAARWFTRWQKLYRGIFEAKEYCCALRYVDLIR